MARSVAFWREKLQRSREESVEFIERRFDNLKAFLGDDAALMGIRGEQTKNIAQLPKSRRSGVDASFEKA